MLGYPKHQYKKTAPRKERQVRWIWNTTNLTHSEDEKGTVTLR